MIEMEKKLVGPLGLVAGSGSGSWQRVSFWGSEDTPEPAAGLVAQQ